MIVVVQGHPVHVDTMGKGPPALFLHGVPDTAELWNEVTPGLADRYRCYAPDFQGIRRSAENPRFDYSFDGYADWVEALTQSLGIMAPVTLVVHDWGGIIGLLWACKYPQRVARIVLMSAPFTHLYRWHFWARIWRTPLLGELSMAAMNRPVFLHEMRRGSRKLGPAQLDAVWRGAPARASARNVILRLYRSADFEQILPWNARLKSLAAKVPLKVLWGEHDPYLPRWLTGHFHTRDVEIVPGIGHWVPTEAPDRVVAALRSAS
jgi:pimeloyl-ACP methyl ester carboxylesterase